MERFYDSKTIGFGEIYIIQRIETIHLSMKEGYCLFPQIT